MWQAKLINITAVNMYFQSPFYEALNFFMFLCKLCFVISGDLLRHNAQIAQNYEQICEFHGKWNRNNEAYARTLKYYPGTVIYTSLVINLFVITYTSVYGQFLRLFETIYIEGPTTNIDLNHANSYSTFVYMQLSINRTKGRKVKNFIALTRFLTFTKIKETWLSSYIIPVTS